MDYKFSRDAVVEILDRALVSVSGKCPVGCPIHGGIEDLDCVGYPCLGG